MENVIKILSTKPDKTDTSIDTTDFKSIKSMIENILAFNDPTLDSLFKPLHTALAATNWEAGGLYKS